MALNYAHSSENALAKVKLSSTIYWLKDADLRAIVEAFGTATAKDSTNTLTSNGAALPTESAVYDFVISQVGGLGRVVTLRSESSHSSVDSPNAGDIVVENDGTEWLYDGSEWREVGSEGAYVLKTTEIAGLALSSDISSAALISALNLGSLAFKDSAAGSLTNYVNGIEGADYTPQGTVTVSLKDTATAATLTSSDYTPEGAVEVTLSQTATAATLTSTDYTPEGTVSVTPTTSSFKIVTSDGSAGTFDAGSYEAPSVNESSSSFATAGVVASIDGTDTEMLVLSAAGTASALTATNFDAGSYQAPSLTGLEMPTTSAVTLATGITSASFTGSKVNDFKITGVSYDKATVSSAAFTGSSVANLKITGVSYDKVSLSSASFAGSSATITPTLTSTTKDVSVS